LIGQEVTMPPVMLALSTFRQSEEAVRLALEKAREPGVLVIVYVVDVNLARYFIGTDMGLYPDLMEKTKEDILREHTVAAEEAVVAISRKAAARGIVVRARVVVGRFAHECLPVVADEKPAVVITTRSGRPEWVRRLFGSPVDRLIKDADCRVLEV